jgi:MFS family permease
LSEVPSTILLLLFMLGISDGATETAYDTVVQADTTQSLRGRVFAVAGAVQQSGMVAGFIAAPILERLFAGAALPTSSFALGAAALLGILVIADGRTPQPVEQPRNAEALWAPAANARVLPVAANEWSERASTAKDLG